MIMKGQDMDESHSIAEARRNLPRLIREAEDGKTVELTRRGFAGAHQDFARTFDIPELALDPDELFEGARDGMPGREVRL